MRADVPLLNSPLMSKGSLKPLQILSGLTSRFVIGDVMKAMVQKGEQPGSFKVMLNGESFNIKGLPASLAGKETSFIVQKGVAGRTELAWLGNAKGGKAATAQTQPGITSGKSATQAKSGVQNRSGKTVQTTLISTIPAGVKTAKAIAARIDSIQAGKMTMTLIQADAKPGIANTTAKQQIITTASMGLKVGQQVSINLTGKTAEGKVVVEIQVQQQTQAAAKVAKAEVQQLALGKLNLAVGDSALAIVQKRLSNGNVQLNIKGVSLETPAPAQVKAGDALEIKLIKGPAEFQVVQLHKNVSQKALSLIRQNLATSHTPIAKNLSTIRNVLPNIDNKDLSSLKGLPQLENLLKSTESSRDYPINGGRLAQIIRDSGGNLESKLQTLISKGGQPQSIQQDLKAILLQISGEQNSGKIQNAETLRLITELSQQSASRIEVGQALNVLANVQGDAARIEFPMLVGQQLINVQLAVQQQHMNQDKDSSSDEQSFGVLFALELSGLGPMRVDANISDKTVYARIYNDHADASSFIQEHIGKLEERLQSLGFDKVYLTASANKPEPEKQQRFDELTSMRPTSFSLLDVLV